MVWRASIVWFLCVGLVSMALPVSGAKVGCVECHRKVTPGHVKDWSLSKHAENGIMCSDCHGLGHHNAQDVNRVVLPNEKVCAQCHEGQYTSFMQGKHRFGWATLNALPVTHLEPDLLMEGAKGCGGCHNMGIKSKAAKEDRRRKGYRYQNNSCDECHTRHTFSKKEAQDPQACQQCHMGFDHPQWEMWVGSKHGSRWFAKQRHHLPPDAKAPTCQTCHLPKGTHANHTAWGFLGVRLPLPKDKGWAKDRVTLLKALGVINPETGQPTSRLDLVKKLDMARLDAASWSREREKMIKICAQCHAASYAKAQLSRGDEMLMHADRLMAQAIRIVAGLYRDGILVKRNDQMYAYPDLLYFMRTDYSSPSGDSDKNLPDGLSYIEQVLLQMYLKHRMRTYQGVFHANPDYAYWYGYAMMTKDLGHIQELARQMRASVGASSKP